MIINVASALNYEDKPYFSIYIAQNNHIDAGKESTLIVVIQNNARLWKQRYDTIEEYQLFSQKPEMLITAYNVSIRFESDKLKINTPEMYFSAIPPFKPIQIPVVVDTRNVKAGEYLITADISYEVIRDTIIESSSSIVPFPSKQIYHYNLTTNPFSPVSKDVVLENTSMYYLQYLKFTYTKKNQKVGLRVVVEKPDVLINVTKVKSNLIAGGKGKITLEIKNEGQSKAENLFLILNSPSGFSISGIQSVDVKEYTKALQTLLSQNPQLSMLGIKSIEISLPPQLQSLFSQGSVYVGELDPGERINVSFTVNVNTDEGGFYPFQIYGIYSMNGEVKRTPSSAFGVEVKDKPKIEVLDVISTVHAGSKGDVIVEVKADQPLESMRGKIETKPPLTALAEEYYAGDVSSAKLRFKVKASDDAENTVYPAKLRIYYSINGKEVEESFDIGIKVGKKTRFEISGKGVIPAGEERIVSVMIKNLGESEIRDATARITVVDPFSTTDDSSYIGVLKPGEEKEISFKIKVDKDATPKDYALNLEVKYRDMNGEWVISDPVKLPIEVKERKNFIPSTGIILTVVAVLLAAYWMRR